MSNHFTIKIPCKKYVKAYLENNCGTPVNLKHLPDLQEILRLSLQRKPEHLENKKVAEYDDTVTVIIPDDMFYRYGWELNKENTLDFNRNVEQKVKFLMRQYISLNYTLGIPVTDCIRNFQEEYGISELHWPYQSIRKDFYRHGVKRIKTIKQINTEINKIFMENLSQLGTISRKFKKEVCNE
jgi:hypothetical protein